MLNTVEGLPEVDECCQGGGFLVCFFVNIIRYLRDSMNGGVILSKAMLFSSQEGVMLLTIGNFHNVMTCR